jgi:hypothetical protein
MIDWEIEECSTFRSSDTVVYSALVAFKTGEVRPLLVLREVGTCDWWGDTCEHVDGAWRELGQTSQWEEGECYIASPLCGDPSFMGEYSHEAQRAGFTGGAIICPFFSGSEGTGRGRDRWPALEVTHRTITSGGADDAVEYDSLGQPIRWWHGLRRREPPAIRRV